MNVAWPPTALDPDPFTIYNHWPLEHFDEVYTVSTTFSTSDPPLWNPLLTASARATALRSYSGQHLTCSGRDHSVKTGLNPSPTPRASSTPAWETSTTEGTSSSSGKNVCSHTGADGTSYTYSETPTATPNAPTPGDSTPTATLTTIAGTTPTTTPRDTTPTATRTGLRGPSGAFRGLPAEQLLHQ